MERTLHLNLKKKWFDMIASGEKKEEYREDKYYWRKRLVFDPKGRPKTITFSNGYAKDRRQMVVELKSVYHSLGIVEWGAPEGVPVYILNLGKIITKNF